MLSANRNAKKDFIPLEYFLDSQQHQTISILVNPKILQKILKLSADEIITLIIFQEYLHIIIKKKNRLILYTLHNTLNLDTHTF